MPPGHFPGASSDKHVPPSDSSSADSPQPAPPSDADADAEKAAPKDSHTHHRAVWILLIASVVSAPFLFGFDLIVVGSTQPQILATLGDDAKLPWVSVAYALAGASTTLLWPRLYGTFNIKHVFLAALLLFEAGTVLSGAAPTMDALIAGRVLSGVGAIGAYAGAVTVLTVVTTIQQRPLYISFITVAYGLSTILAPVLGGVLADSRATWRWAFYLNACIAAVLAPAYLLLLPSTSFVPRAMSLTTRLQRLDLLGNVLWAGASTALITGISSGGTLWAWSGGQSIACFVVAGVIWLLFGVQQCTPILTSKEARILPLNMLHSLEMANLFLQSAASSSVILIPVFFVPIYFSFVRGASALQASLYVLPLVVLRSVFILLNGAMLRRLGYVMPWFVAGAALSLAGSAPFLAASPSTSPANIVGWTVLIGAGVGMCNQAPFAVAQARTTPALAPQAIGLITTGQVGGSAAVLAVCNAIFINRANSNIAAVIPAAQAQQVGASLVQGAQQGVLDALSPGQRTAVVEGIVRALNAAWIPVVAAAGVSLVLAPFLKRDRLFRK